MKAVQVAVLAALLVYDRDVVSGKDCRRRGVDSEAFAVIGELFGGREAIGWRAAGEPADGLCSPTLIETELDRSD